MSLSICCFELQLQQHNWIKLWLRNNLNELKQANFNAIRIQWDIRPLFTYSGLQDHSMHKSHTTKLIVKPLNRLLMSIGYLLSQRIYSCMDDVVLKLIYFEIDGHLLLLELLSASLSWPFFVLNERWISIKSDGLRLKSSLGTTLYCNRVGFGSTVYP